MVGKRKRKISDIGERELIQRFQQLITPNKEALLMGSEDAVAISLNGEALVINTDMLVASTDILPSMTAEEVAWKTGVMGLSDLAAKGAAPLGVLFSFGLPEDMEESYVLELVRGLNQVCREHDTYYLGGDTNKCTELTITCTAIGKVPKTELIKRRGSKPGDIVAITGEFGYTGALFEILIKGYQIPKRILEKIRSKALRPRARIQEGRALSSAHAVTAAIDSSDGLAWSLQELVNMNQVGFYIDQLPVPKVCADFSKMHELDVYDLILYGGEEFELVVTIPSDLWNTAIRSVQRVGGQLFPIGKVTSEKKNILVRDGEEHAIEPRGYEHFY
jgi:thiamine-monophosphate kinase